MVPVRRLFGWTAGLVSIAALARIVARRRRHVAPPPAGVGEAQDPAEELRRKLSETRQDTASSDPVDTAPTETLDERRSRVHAKAQQAIEAMQDVSE